MAVAKKTVVEQIELTKEGEPRPRLHKLIIKNFRSIGQKPLEIELDEIVILVGPNNAGKSSILRAYEVVMTHGSKEGKLSINDFTNGIVNPDHLPTIELHTIVHNDAPGKRWIKVTENNENLIREKWTWESPNKEPIRQGYDCQKDDWDDQVPWGAPNVANTKRPLPHRIDAFASPESQATKITDLITELLREKLSSIKTLPEQEKSDYELVLEKIKDLQLKVVVATEQEIGKIEEEISQYLEKVFPKHKIKFNPNPESDIEKTYTPFKTSADLLMGTKEGYFSKIEHQGSGARRTLLWATLKYLSDSKDKVGARPHVLLLDEPEICLHPSAIREARSVLYGLPSTGNWQVMITSHSPIFIDLSQDNTTIIRVFRDDADLVQSTTLYRPERAKLDVNDKKNMKLLNICDPYLHEFFFGGRQIIVEGDTEFTAFSKIKELFPNDYQDVQIIRARGKGVIPSIAKVLLQFSKAFSILHDTDSPKTLDGKNNPAWGMNKTISEILELENAKDRVELVACKTCFEIALFGKEVTYEKPYNVLNRIDTDDAAKANVKKLLDYLLDPTKEIPLNCISWKKIEDLE